MKVKRTCLQCSKEFETEACWIKKGRGDGKYCSKACMHKYLKGKPNKGRKRPKVVCQYCKKVFETYKAWLKRGSSKFCSKKCYVAAQRVNSLLRLGKKRTTQREAYNTLLYKEWRTSVFKRDHYICQWCNAKSGNGKDVYLEAHHIKSWKNYPELRFVVDNGLTLCKDCHNTTRGDYNNFLKKGE